MRIHRLLLQDFRGVTRREITFPESGVVVVAGPNEVGKSSLVLALDLLLTKRDSSKDAAVRAVQPVGSDVGSVVEAELTLGPHRLVYRKQWNRRPATSLRILTPAVEQLTGRPAHERVETLMEQFLDSGLMAAQRVMQTGRDEPWSASIALTRALDLAAGRAAAEGAGEDLMSAVEAEYRVFHTAATGRPTGPLKEHQAARDAALADVERVRADVARLDDLAAEHEWLSQELSRLDIEIGDRTGDLESLTVKQQAVMALTARVAHLAETVEGRAEKQARVGREHRARIAQAQQLIDLAEDTERRARAVRHHQEALVPARVRLADADAALRIAAGHVAAAGEAAEAAGRHADECTARQEFHRLTTVLAELEQTERQLADAQADLLRFPVTAVHLARIDKAQRALDLAVAAADGAAARIALDDLGPGMQLRVAGTDAGRGHLAAGGQLPVTEETGLELLASDGTVLVRLRVAPAAGATELAARVAAARHVLDAALTEAGVPDPLSAAAAAEQHRDAAATVDRHRRRLDELTVAAAGADRVTLAARRERLREQLAAQAGELPDTANANELAHQAHLAADRARQAQEEATRARRAEAAAREARDRAATAVQELERLLTREQTVESSAIAQLDTATAQLRVARTEIADEQLAADLLRADAELTAAVADHSDAVDTLRELAEPGLDDAIATLSRHLDTTRAAKERTGNRLSEVTGELQALGGAGLQERLDAAETVLAAAEDDLRRTLGQARAVALLRDTLVKHRDIVRARYTEPFRQALVELGRAWLGPTFDVTVGPGLEVQERTLHGTTLEVDRLSTGAAEQIQVLIRLATASVVGGSDGVPVIFDDALGFTDSERLATLGPVFEAIGDAQVILLTCTPERYRAIGGAQVLDLAEDVTRAVPAKMVPTAAPAAPSAPATLPAPAPQAAAPARARRRPVRSLPPADDLDPQLALLVFPDRGPATDSRTA